MSDLVAGDQIACWPVQGKLALARPSGVTDPIFCVAASSNIVFGIR